MDANENDFGCLREEEVQAQIVPLPDLRLTFLPVSILDELRHLVRDQVNLTVFSGIVLPLRVLNYQQVLLN